MTKDSQILKLMQQNNKWLWFVNDTRPRRRVVEWRQRPIRCWNLKLLSAVMMIQQALSSHLAESCFAESSLAKSCFAVNLTMTVEDDDNSFSRFLVITANMHVPTNYQILHFAIQKLLKCAVRDVASAKKLANGSKQQEITSYEHVGWFQWLTPDRFLNSSRGHPLSRISWLRWHCGAWCFLESRFFEVKHVFTIWVFSLSASKPSVARSLMLNLVF